ATEPFAFTPNQSYRLGLEVSGSELVASMDDVPVLKAQDNRLQSGQCGFFVATNAEALFLEITVENLRADAPVLYRFPFQTSAYADFAHHCHDFVDRAWPANPPTNANFSANSFASAWPAPRQPVTATEIQVLPNGDGFLLQSPEPMEWDRIEARLSRSSRILETSIPGAMKLMGMSLEEGQLELLTLDAVAPLNWRVEFAVDSDREDWHLLHTFVESEKFGGTVPSGVRFSIVDPALEPLALDGLLERAPHNSVGADPFAELFADAVQRVAVRIVNAEGEVVHQRDFAVGGAADPVAVRVLPNEDGRAALILPLSGSIRAGMYRLRMTFAGEKPGMETLRRGGEIVSESAVLEFEV
ncbi:MAG: hypothetical protein AAF570_02430, partial [Bacteroidota bacterium]